MPEAPGDNATPTPPDSEPSPEPTPSPELAAKAPRKAKRKKKRVNEARPGQHGKKGPHLSLDEARFSKLAKNVVGAIRLGVAEYVAVLAAGVAPRTHREWRAHGKIAYDRRDAGEELTEREERLADYYQRCREGAAVAQVQLTQILHRAAVGKHDPAAANIALQVLLKNRRFNSHWGSPPQRTELTGKDGAPVNMGVSIALADIDELRRRANANESDAEGSEDKG